MVDKFRVWEISSEDGQSQYYPQRYEPHLWLIENWSGYTYSKHCAYPNVKQGRNAKVFFTTLKGAKRFLKSVQNGRAHEVKL